MQYKADERRKDMTQGTSRSQVILATLGVAMALLLAALDQTVVGVAMPRIVSDLHGIELYAWVTTAYLITSTALVPVAGKLGDMFGRKPFMLAGMVGFVAASALCGVSQNMMELVLPRGISHARLRDIDFIGTALLLAGLTPLLISLSMLRDHSWLSVQVLGLLGLAGVLLVAFFITERRVEHPIVPFQLFRRNVFAVPALMAFFSAIGMFGAIVFVPLVYQGVLGVSASNSGQLLTPMQLAVVVTATATGVLLARVPRYRFVGTAALAAMILGLVLLAQIGPHSSPWEVTRDIVIIG